MTTPIEVPCICHVPPPEGTVRIEIRKPKEGEWYFSSVSCSWGLTDCDFEEESLPVAIIAPQYIYPTPVEALQMLEKSGQPIECEFTDQDEWPVDPAKGELVGIKRVANGELCFINRSGFAWRKIRVPKPNP